LLSPTDPRSYTYLNLPVRPGDVIVIPERGEVFVHGGVEKPGAYPVTPRLTILGAVAAAGGTRFVADAGSVVLIRAGANGDKVVYQADLESIQSGEIPDIPIEPGDIIEVSYSTAKLLVSWTYSFVKAVFGVGTRAW
jgi:polysaccharide export outer membrane protein